MYDGSIETVEYIWVNIWCIEIGDRMCKNSNPLQGLTLDGTT